MNSCQDPWGALGAGSSVTVLPQRPARILHGQVLAPTSGRDPRVLRAALRPAGVLSTTGEPVWISFRSPTDGSLTVVLATARELPPRHGEVELGDPRRVADEPRRAGLRAATECPALLVRPGRASRGTRTVDLSSQGCRVVLPAGPGLVVGQSLQIAMAVDHGATVWADGVVVWVDEQSGQVAMRFTRVTAADVERLDRRVLAALSAPG